MRKDDGNAAPTEATIEPTLLRANWTSMASAWQLVLNCFGLLSLAWLNLFVQLVCLTWLVWLVLNWLGSSSLDCLASVRGMPLSAG